MRRIRSKNYPSHSKRRCAPPLHPIWTDVRDLVVAWFGVSGEDLLVAHWLAGDKFFAREAGSVAVGYAVEAVYSDARSHVEVLEVDDEVCVCVVVAVEVVVDLWWVSSRIVMEWEGNVRL